MRVSNDGYIFASLIDSLPVAVARIARMPLFPLLTSRNLKRCKLFFFFFVITARRYNDVTRTGLRAPVDVSRRVRFKRGKRERATVII